MCVQLNLGTGSTGAFSVAADDALNQTLSPPFTPYENNLFFLHGAFIFEDVGVTAYQVRVSARHHSHAPSCTGAQGHCYCQVVRQDGICSP